MEAKYFTDKPASTKAGNVGCVSDIGLDSNTLNLPDALSSDSVSITCWESPLLHLPHGSSFLTAETLAVRSL